MLTLSTPLGLPEWVATLAIADWMDSTPPATEARKRSPSSVRVRLRVLRWNSRTPRLRSSVATLRLTAAGVRPSRRAAAEKPPHSALRMNDSRLASVSTVRS